jgi:hypothetical protein
VARLGGIAELRVLAHVSNCKSMIQAFIDGGDFHSRTAINMFKHVKQAGSIIAAGDLIASMAARFNETNGTRVPHWVFASCECNVMPGQHALAVFADSLVKGVRGLSAADGARMAHVALDKQVGEPPERAQRAHPEVARGNSNTSLFYRTHAHHRHTRTRAPIVIVTSDQAEDGWSAVGHHVHVC